MLSSSRILLTFAASILACATMIGIGGAASAKTGATTASIAIDQTQKLPVIEPAVYGQFAEHLGAGIYGGIWVGPESSIPNTRGYRNDVLEALKRLHVPVIRWPGGCFADEYDWRDGIGPRDKRPKRVNGNWGGIEDNAFGTHEFMDFAEMIGADVYLAGNMGSLPPRSMAQWVEYITSPSDSTLAQERRANGRDKPWRLKYIGVGNETWGCGGNMTPETSAAMHRRYYTFLRPAAANGPMIRVASGAADSDYHFTETMLRDAGGQMDAISLHYYTLRGDWNDKGAATGFDADGWAWQLDRARRMEELLIGHSKVMDRFDPAKRIALYVDEWGNWFDSEPGKPALYQQNTLLDAVTAAETLNIFHRHTDRVKLAAIAQMVNVLQAMILTDGPRMVLTPTYHVFEMYRPFQGATPYPLAVTSPQFTKGKATLPMVDATAARGKDGKLWVAVVNMNPEVAVDVRVADKGKATGRILTADKMDAYNTFNAPDVVKPAPYSARSGKNGLVLKLPAKSVVVVSIE